MTNLHTLISFFLHRFQDKVLGLVSYIYVWRECNLIRNDSIKIQLRIYSKRNFAQYAFISHHTNIPYINFIIVFLTFNNLRRIVKGTSWSCFSHAEATIYCPTKITNLNNSKIEQYVFGFNISVNDKLFMNVVHSFTNLFYYGWYIFLIHSSLSSQFL